MSYTFTEKVCDFCGDSSEFHMTFRGTKINGTLCEECGNHVPPMFFTNEWDGNADETWLLIMLKLGYK